MKTLKPTKLLFLFFLSFALLYSCDKDDDSSEQQSDTFIQFSINDTDYDFKDIITVSGSSTSFTLNGNNGEGITNPGNTRIGVFLPNPTTMGTYDIDGGAFGGDYKISFTSEPLGFDFDFADSGSITITSVTEDFIEGTFSASVTSNTNTTINIKDGKFKGFTID